MTQRNLALAHAAMEDRNWRAAETYARAAIDAGHPEANEVLAGVAWKQRDYAAARAAYESLEAPSPLAIALLARLRLLSGDYSRGWALVGDGCRAGLFGPSLYDLPRWDGEDPSGRRLVVWGLGYGDDMLFARFVPALAKRGATVSLNCRPAMVRLFQSLPGVTQVLPVDQVVEDAELQVHLAELPALFEAQPENVWPGRPYLSAEPAPLIDGRFRVGLVWACESSHWEAQERSAYLAQLAPLTKVPGVRLYSLQTGSQRAELSSPPTGMELLDLAQDFADFADTAATIAALDLVITIDTAVANLAGAMGKAVWVAVPYIPDWRWGERGATTPWYPSARVFRQPAPGDWPSVYRSMAEHLAPLAQAA